MQPGMMAVRQSLEASGSFLVNAGYAHFVCAAEKLLGHPISTRAKAHFAKRIQVGLAKWSGKYPKLTSWVEENIDETLTFYRLPRQHHKHLKSTNMLERLNEEIKRRTHVVRIFPNGESCLRL